MTLTIKLSGAGDALAAYHRYPPRRPLECWVRPGFRKYSKLRCYAAGYASNQYFKAMKAVTTTAIDQNANSLRPSVSPFGFKPER